jgi:hypothetical protein
MGILLDKINDLNKSSGDIVTNFKDNSLFFYEKYSKSDDMVKSISVSDMQLGGFYFIHYRDDSNWMKWSPIFTVDFKKFSNLNILFGLNFNFIPLEVRVSIFDKYISEKDFEKNKLLNVNYQGVYKELIKYGFEYSIVEYNLNQINYVHKIGMEMVPRFLYSQHPKNIYDPKKVYQIWKSKISTKIERDKEINKMLISDFFKMTDDILKNYNQLESHIDRIQKSYEKYGS